MIKSKHIYYIALIITALAFFPKSVLATGVLPKLVTIGGERYYKVADKTLNRDLVPYVKQIRNNPSPGVLTYQDDWVSPHMTIEHYDQTTGTLQFHVTGAGNRGQHDDKYEYNSQTGKLMALAQVPGVAQLRRTNVTDISRGDGYAQADDLAREFVQQLDQANFF